MQHWFGRFGTGCAIKTTTDVEMAIEKNVREWLEFNQTFQVLECSEFEG